MTARRHLTRLFTFGIVGALSAAVYLAVTALLVHRLGVTVANLFAFIAAASVSYVGHHSYTFGATGHHDVHAPRFLVQCLLAYSLSLAITEGAAALRLHHMVGAAAAVILVPLMNYLVFLFWVFAAPNPTGDN